jgi:RES domain
VIDSVFAHVGLADVHGDLFRNIVSLRVSEDLFDDLSDDPAHWDSAIQLELRSKPPVFVSAIPVVDRPFEEAQWNDAIGYPFRNWMRSRYSDGSFGVWYGSDSIETTVFETAYHWYAMLLGDAGFTQPGIRIERKVFRVRCDAAVIDLRPAVPTYPALVDRSDYTLTHQIGARLHREGHPGLVSNSARCDGDMYAVFNARVLSRPRQTCSLTYTTTGTGIVIERAPGQPWFEIERY